MLVAAFLIAGALIAQDAQVTPLMSKDLPECPGVTGHIVFPRTSHAISRLISRIDSLLCTMA
jgi:hypothetical protein